MKTNIYLLTTMLALMSAVSHGASLQTPQAPEHQTEIKNTTPQQHNNHAGESKLKAVKIAYMTEKIGLTPAESQKFWPLYNQYWAERRDLAHRKRGIFDRIKNNTLNGRELDEMFELMDAEAATMRRWATEFKKVFPADKVAKVFMSEETFKHYLLQQKRQ